MENCSSPTSSFLSTPIRTIPLSQQNPAPTTPKKTANQTSTTTPIKRVFSNSVINPDEQKGFKPIPFSLTPKTNKTPPPDDRIPEIDMSLLSHLFKKSP